MSTNWDASMETGDPHIDRQHREIIELVDRLDSIGEDDTSWIGTGTRRPLTDDSLIAVRAQLADAITDLIAVIQSYAMKTIDATDRQNLAKYLTIARVRLENAITLVRRGGADH